MSLQMKSIRIDELVAQNAELRRRAVEQKYC
jgi:hypothetical protein